MLQSSGLMNELLHAAAEVYDDIFVVSPIDGCSALIALRTADYQR
jgi:hypothetical protein